MKSYRLIEKRNDLTKKITYEVEIWENENEPAIYLTGRDKDRVFFSGKIAETKRGWTITSWWLTSKPIKIFLPRENFEKVEIE